MDDIRSFKDFLTVYNTLTEMCFYRCVNNFNSRTLDPNEGSCADKCAAKFLAFSNRMTRDYVKVQSQLLEKRANEEAAATSAAVAQPQA